MSASATVVRIGTRGSELAHWQARRVSDLLTAHGTNCAIDVIRTSGDTPSPGGQASAAVKGLFTKELEEALLEGRIDLAVHSLKDLMIDVPDGLILAAFPEREDPRDALVTREGAALEDLAHGAIVGTSSVRRAAAVRAARPDVTITELRGNVTTRLKRVDEGRVDAAVLALAGLRRLGQAGRAAPLPATVIVPAPGQGALAVEARADDGQTLALTEAIDDRGVRTAVTAERAALAELETGCNVPIGALCTSHGVALRLFVAVYAVDGSTRLTVEVPVDALDPEASGRDAARELLLKGARELIDEATKR